MPNKIHQLEIKKGSAHQKKYYHVLVVFSVSPLNIYSNTVRLESEKWRPLNKIAATTTYKETISDYEQYEQNDNKNITDIISQGGYIDPKVFRNPYQVDISSLYCMEFNPLLKKSINNSQEVYTFSNYITVNSLTTGGIEYLNYLLNNKQTDDTIFIHQLMSTLKSLEHFIY